MEPYIRDSTGDILYIWGAAIKTHVLRTVKEKVLKPQ
jgi:hypothetical protein